MKKNKDQKKSKESKKKIKEKELKELSEKGLNKEKSKKKKKEKEKEKKKEKRKELKKDSVKTKKPEGKKDKKKPVKVKKEAQTSTVLTPERVESKPAISKELNTPSNNSSSQVNARTAISVIRSLKTVESVKNYIKGDERITVKKAGLTKINSLSD